MSRAGFRYKTSVAFNEGPTVSSVNTFIRTNPVPAKNMYRWKHGQKAVPKIRGKKEFYITAKETIDSDKNKIVLPEGHSVSRSVLEREITRGTQKGYKTCLSGPHRPLPLELKANVNKETGFMSEKGSEDKDQTPVSNKKWNIAGSTYHGGWKDVVDNLGRDLNGRDKTSLTGFGTALKTTSKFVGGPGTAGGRAGMRGKVKTASK